MLHERALEAGAYNAGRPGLNSVLQTLEKQGRIERTIRGKRCYRIAAVGVAEPPIEPQAQTQLSTADSAADEHTGREERSSLDAAHDGHTIDVGPVVVGELEPDIEAVVDAALDAIAPYVEHSPLVATVHLALDVDPTTARLVLDLVEHCRSLRPIDRAETKQLIAQAQNKATARSAEGMGRVLDRVSELESTVGSIVAGMRGLGVSTQTNGHKARAVRPDFRALGVKDSEQRKLLTDLALDGWTLTRKSNGHISATKPEHKPIELSSSPSDHRTSQNDRHRARSLGAAV